MIKNSHKKKTVRFYRIKAIWTYHLQSPFGHAIAHKICNSKQFTRGPIRSKSCTKSAWQNLACKSAKSWGIHQVNGTNRRQNWQEIKTGNCIFRVNQWLGYFLVCQLRCTYILCFGQSRRNYIFRVSRGGTREKYNISYRHIIVQAQTKHLAIHKCINKSPNKKKPKYKLVPKSAYIFFNTSRRTQYISLEHFSEVFRNSISLKLLKYHMDIFLLGKTYNISSKRQKVSQFRQNIVLVDLKRVVYIVWSCRFFLCFQFSWKFWNFIIIDLEFIF